MNSANTINAGLKIARFNNLLLSFDSLLEGYNDLKESFKDTMQEIDLL